MRKSMRKNTSKDDSITKIDYCVFGAKILIELLGRFKGQIDGAKKGKDIEYIHRIRVASRRMRAAISVFRKCYEKSDAKRWRAEIKKITRSLGAARDMDVQIAFLEKHLRNVSNQRSRVGIQFLLSKHKENRRGMQPTIIKVLDELMGSGILNEIRTVCGTIVRRASTSPSPRITYSEANKHILTRHEELLQIEHCVYREDAALEHHKMRIATKRLRYTMEIFSTLYKDKLDEQIRTAKNIQDLLGEVHDCDVWIDYIPKFIESSKEELASKNVPVGKIHCIEASLLQFIDYLRSRRKALFTEFVGLWSDIKDRRVLNRLTETTGILACLAQKQNPKVALIADVHANLHALEAVLSDARSRGADVFLNTGDFVGYGAFPDEVIKKLRFERVFSVIGNYDIKVIQRQYKKKMKRSKNVKKVVLDYAKKNLSNNSLNYLTSLPKEIRVRIGGKRLLLVHGSPISMDEHILPDTPAARLKYLAKISNADVVIIGHSHIQFTKTISRVTFINPGSIGRPDDGDPRAAYAIMTLNPFSIELIRVEYDVEAEVNAIRRKRLPEALVKMLLFGVSLDKILEYEEAKKLRKGKALKTILDRVRMAARKYKTDQNHPEYVRALSLKLFDELKKQHHLGAEERFYLECAAILHDIGWYRGGSEHHKNSLELILKDQDLPFSPIERYIVGSIARYHRKRIPWETDYNLKPLSSRERRNVTLSASLLKIADGLDVSHTSGVWIVNVKTTRKKAILTCIISGDRSNEEQAVNEKKDLFEKVFDRKLIVKWRQKSIPSRTTF